jgi:UDP-N-acetylmuramyl tripeptide synthase
VFVDGIALDTGDYSGPAGARMVLRDGRVEAASFETARGGILRRGLAVSRVHAAVVTNVSADHFGEYGIHDLDALADVKLTVASLVGTRAAGLNTDDAISDAARRHRGSRTLGRVPPLGWFALDYLLDALRAHRRAGDRPAECREDAGAESRRCRDDLGLVAEMPLTIEGTATYNVSNLAGAALVASALGVVPATIAAVFARFGADPADNFGRMMRFDVWGVRVLVDYAHNPDGLRGVMRVAEHLRGGKGRLGMLLGHAGNREDADIEQLAAVAAGFRPDLIVVKEIEGYLRGRAVGEVPRILRAALLRDGVPASAVQVRMSEVDAAVARSVGPAGRRACAAGHSLPARTTVLGMLECSGRIGRI